MQLEQQQQQTLTVEQEQRILAILNTYQELTQDARLLQDQADTEKAKVYAMLKEFGIEKTTIEGTLLTEVGGETSKFNPQKFVAAGGNLDHYNAAIEKKPKKKYLKITLAGEQTERATE